MREELSVEYIGAEWEDDGRQGCQGVASVLNGYGLGKSIDGQHRALGKLLDED